MHGQFLQFHLLLPFLNFNTGLKLAISGFIPFICPIMMVFMIPMMLKGMGNKNSDANMKAVSKNDESDITE